MMKKLIVFSILLLSLVIVTMAQASVFDISVTEAGDRVYNRNWGYYGTWTSWDVGANPNKVSHTYWPGYGDSNSTYLTFDISSFDVPSTEIVSVSLYINILSVWTEGRDDIGTLSSGGTVYASGGTGWKSFDITDSFKAILDGTATTADYAFNYTGYSGFTFSSAEGGLPAYLHITTTGQVPIPAAIWLLGSGLVGCAGLRKFRLG